MQRERVGRVSYGTPQRIRIGGGSANVLWLQIGGPFAVICGCHMENGCEDEAFHRLGCPSAAANAVNFGLPQMPQQKKRENEALAVVTH